MNLQSKVWWVVLGLIMACDRCFGASLGMPQPELRGQYSLYHDPLSPFTADEVREFLDAVERADRIRDPMSRCLSFPDPPGTRWSVEAVKAVCAYRLQETMHFDVVKSLIESGHAADIDQKLASWGSDSAHHPEAVWRFLNQNFGSYNDEVRALLEKWKQQSPESSVVHMASGFSFLQ